ncbi:conserved hypothetical protein [Leishmania infantum JPCM5]|uniref:Uncharacterized protein n=2 Tax=Leishmania infantum TaxID=5671 RepID=A4HU33_LEIIN|nr:conserved hypothetical protein [Leishmania infantum JPCM5]CAC9455069.1 hypothetical_protein_-__conserved [Leishmania infantum]CAM65939.1 conserved hypothetical protein [Leishmania infantum JPCM5]SUZ39568.1 hypothetical_protein_-__conserved [Leishmania infantum]|eukprot:XP_001463574.1 conserved hypothetical protein [Leishmania infantum JPCM5]
MFLFRHSAEPMEEEEEHHEPVDSTMEPHNADTAAAEERRTSADVADGDISREPSGFAESFEETGGAPHTPREGTVPPPHVHDMLQHQHLHDEDDVEADMAAAAPAASAPAPSHGVPALPMPHTCNEDSQAEADGNGAQRHRSFSHTSRFAAPSPRSTSGISRGRSYSLSGLSAAELADVHEQRYRRCTSVVKSARCISARRASSVNGVVGVIDDLYTLASRRSSVMTEGERVAVERMMENEYRRQEAAERSAQLALARESTIVNEELAREKAMYVRRMRLNEELHARLAKSSRIRQERMTAAAQRRQEIEQERLRVLYDSMMEKDTRYHFRNPYEMMAAQRRYSIEMRNPAAIAPQRRTSSPSTRANGNAQMSPHSSDGVANGTTEDRCTSSPATRRRSSTPSIAKSKPRQCLPLDAWKKPEPPRKDSCRSDISAEHRCRSPNDWRATAVLEHPRQWR